MSDAWRWLMRIANGCGDRALSGDHVLQWPHATVEHWIDQGVLAPADVALRLICTECNELAGADVVWVGDRAILPCVHCGPLQIDPARLSCWRISIPVLVDQIRQAMGLKGTVIELVQGHLWRLGNMHWSGIVWPVICGRGLSSVVAAGWLDDVRTTPQTIFVSLSGLPSRELSGRCAGATLALDELAADRDGVLNIDLAELQLCLPKPASFSRRKGKSPKRAIRVAHIENLIRELIEHVRSAREYAINSQERTGTPLLLPRPTCEELAARLKVDKSTVSRCLADASAHELRLVWELAVDLDRILGQ